MRRGTFVGLAAAGLWLLCSAPSFAAERGEIGGPPTLKLPRGDFYKKLTSEVIVIGRGEAFNGPVEVVAVNTKRCLIIEIDRPLQGEVSGSSCYAAPGKLGIKVTSVQFTGFPNNRKRSYSEYAGSIDPGVARVTVVGKSGKRRKRVSATLAHPDAGILARLGLSQPISVWTAALRGCITGRRLITRAFDSNGTLLGSASDPHHRGFDFCRSEFSEPVVSGAQTTGGS